MGVGVGEKRERQDNFPKPSESKTGDTKKLEPNLRFVKEEEIFPEGIDIQRIVRQHQMRQGGR
jgi:hypothetical protein